MTFTSYTTCRTAKSTPFKTLEMQACCNFEEGKGALDRRLLFGDRTNHQRAQNSSSECTYSLIIYTGKLLKPLTVSFQDGVAWQAGLRAEAKSTTKQWANYKNNGDW